MAQQLNSRQALRALPAEYASVIVEEVPDTRTPEQRAEDEATQIQAKSEGVDLDKDRRVTLGKGDQEKKFRIADSIGLMPLMEFAYHANSGLDTSDMEALAAIYEMLKDCISDQQMNADPETGKPVGPTEWDRFRAHAKAIKADAEVLMDVVQQTVELLTGRPTVQDSGSSPQLRQMSDSLTDTSSGQREGLVSVADLGKVSSG